MTTTAATRTTYRERERRGVIQSALNRVRVPHSADDNARLAAYWRAKGDSVRAERFASLAGLAEGKQVAM